jgi:hypothetical protein
MEAMKVSVALTNPFMNLCALGGFVCQDCFFSFTRSPEGLEGAVLFVSLCVPWWLGAPRLFFSFTRSL